jgi:hypothetical protein
VLVEVADLGLDALQDVLGLLAGAQQDHALDGVVLGLEPELAQARRDADGHAADILDQHRRAVVDGQDDVSDIFQGLKASDTADVVKLPALRIEAAAGVGVVGGERGLHLADGEADPGQLVGVEQHLVLHLAAAEAAIVGDAGHGLEGGLHDPVLESLQLHGRAVGALQDVAVDQPGRRGQRRHGRLDPVRQAEVAQAVEDFLARRVAVRPVPVGDHQVRQAVERNRSRHGRARQAVHADFRGHGDQALDFFGGVARPLGDQLHHRRREVGIGVHRQALQRPDPDRHQDQGHQRDQPGLAQARAHHPVHHRGRARRRGWVGRRGVAHWLCMNCMKTPPSATIRSPAFKPLRTGNWSPVRSPRVTRRRANPPPGWAT